MVWSNEAVALPTPTRAKYTFIGWSDAPDGGSTDVSEILANLVAEGGTEITLYALWSKNPDATVPTVPTFPTNPPAVEAYSLRNTGNSYTKTYEYDLAGNRTSFVLTKDGETVHNIVYQYDALNRLTGVKQAGQSIAAYEYDANGNRTRLAYPVSQTITSYTYNKANWVTGVTSRKGNTTLSRYQYTYYASGNQKRVTDKDNVVTGYLYDDLGRLTRETQGSGNNGLTVAYTYDTAGNRTKMVVTGAENYTTTYTYDANNRLTKENKKVGGTTTTTVYAYDGNGNLLRKSNPNGAEQYEYNGLNQLTQTRVGNTVAEYIYNANGIRTSKQVGTSTTYYLLDGGDVVAEYTDGALTASYLRGINLLSRVTTDGTEYYLHNAHGDVVALTNTSGTVTKRYDYDAFGNEENPDSADANPFRYCGEYFDTETGTYYLRARYYDPAIGRFTQQDTYLGDYKDPLSLNYYTYCYNNPVRYYDPSGNIPVDTILDAASFVDSLVQFVFNPSLVNAGYLAWDTVSVILPYIPGSYAAKGVRLVGRTDDAIDLVKSLYRVDNATDAASWIVKNRKSLLMSYKDWKKVTKELKIKGFEIHHLIEKRFADKLGLNKNSILSIAIDPDLHATITQAFRDVIGYKNDISKSLRTNTAEAHDIWDAIVNVYRGLGMEQYISQLKEFIQKYASAEALQNIIDFSKEW